jgi:hypothetical protein
MEALKDRPDKLKLILNKIDEFENKIKFEELDQGDASKKG